MPLISRIPEFMAEHDLPAKVLERAVVRTGVKFGWNTAWGLSKGNLPSVGTLEKLCDTYKRQPDEFEIGRAHV